MADIKKEQISGKEKLINPDGTATQYLMRYLQRLSASGATSTTITYPVTSVNGQTGDVVIDIPDIQEAIAGQIIIVAENVDEKIAAHNADESSHPDMPFEKSPKSVSENTGAIPSISWVAPHFHSKGFKAQGVLSYSSNAGGFGFKDNYPANGAGAGLFGAARNVYVSAFYNPHREMKVLGVCLPVPGGEGTSGSDDASNCLARKCAIFKASNTTIEGGRPVKEFLKGISLNSCSLISQPSAGYYVIQLDSADYALLNPVVGDICSTPDSASYKVLGARITAIDAINSRVTVYTGGTGGAFPIVRARFILFGPQSGFSARWLGQLVWSSTGFTDYSTNQEDGWILGSASLNSVENMFQSQVVSMNGSSTASILSNFDMDEGIYFLVVVEAAIGVAATRNQKAIVIPADDADFGETNGAGITYYGKGNSFCRGYMSDHLTSRDFAAAGSNTPIYDLINFSTGFNVSPTNFFACLNISDADTVSALDELLVDQVFPDIPYTAENVGITNTGTENFDPAVGDGFVVPAGSGYISPIMFPIVFMASFVK